MTPKRRRLAGVLVVAALLGGAAALALSALEDSVVFFLSPTEIAVRADLPDGRKLRVGGLVKEGSVRRGAAGVSFVVTDLQNEVRVRYGGILPDLFREGQGVVAEGTLAPDGSLRASAVLARHDENYMPPEVAEALRKSGRWRSGDGGGR